MNSIAILIGLGMLGISIPFVIRPFRQKYTKNVNKTNTHAQVAREPSPLCLRYETWISIT